MRLLIDTHTLLWWFAEPERLSRRVRTMLSTPTNTVFVSAASGWELAIKVNLGKLDALDLVVDLSRYVNEEGFEELAIDVAAAIRAGLLPNHHRDPFDRLLVAQAQLLNIPILSSDLVLDAYDVKRIW
jgi:PIN domain nuclease of toxin-antitoxin system